MTTDHVHSENSLAMYQKFFERGFWAAPAGILADGLTQQVTWDFQYTVTGVLLSAICGVGILAVGRQYDKREDAPTQRP